MLVVIDNPDISCGRRPELGSVTDPEVYFPPALVEMFCEGRGLHFPILKPVFSGPAGPKEPTFHISAGISKVTVGHSSISLAQKCRC